MKSTYSSRRQPKESPFTAKNIAKRKALSDQKAGTPSSPGIDTEPPRPEPEAIDPVEADAGPGECDSTGDERDPTPQE